MRLQAWPAAAKITAQAFAIEAHSRGAVLPSGIGGFEIATGARFTGQVSVAPMLPNDAFAFRAFLHSLRGRGGSFMLPIGAWLEATRTGGAPTTSSLASASSAGSDTVSIALATGVTLNAGNLIVVGDPAFSGQVVRVVSVSVGATISATVRPRLRVAFGSGALVRFAGMTARCRLVGNPPAVAIAAGGRSLPLQIDIEEDY